MQKISGKWSRIGVLSVEILLFHLCLCVTPGFGHREADLTQTRTRRTSPNGAPTDGNESPHSAPNKRVTVDTNGADTPPTDSQSQERSSRNEGDKQFRSMMFSMFEGQLLANLGFEKVPRSVNTSLPPVPDYMFHLYQNLKRHTRQQKRFKASDADYPKETSDMFQEAIRGYRVMSEIWKRPGRGYLVFNTTSQPLKENITHVELVLYMCPNTSLVQPRADSENTGTSLTQRHINVSITLRTKRKRRHNRVNLRLPVESNRSCLPINITKMVRKGFAQRRTILNFSIEISSTIDPSTLHSCQSSGNEKEKRPLLVIYENILPFTESRLYNITRQKRRVSKARNITSSGGDQIRNRSDTVHFNSTSLSSPTLNGNTTNTTNTTSYPINCHLRRWYVSFEELQWNHVIVHPTGYIANYCWGLCPAFLDNVNSTNHAYIRSKYMLLQQLPPDIPEPFCAPIRMSPLTLLYRIREDVIITKILSEMVVAECSCM